MTGGVWRRLEGQGRAGIDVVVDGLPARAFEGESVAMLLLRLGRDHFGPHPTTGEPLAPWCLMGTCFGCLCTIDGRSGTQACLVPVAQGLDVITDVAMPATARASAS